MPAGSYLFGGGLDTGITPAAGKGLPRPLHRAGDNGNNVVLMPTRPSISVLGEFELLVLLAALSLGERSYPVSVAADIERRTGRKASRAAVLITLERLEDKGMLSSWYGDPTPVRGGRAKRHFTVKPLGIQAVRQALARVRAMTAGLEYVLKLS